MVEMVMQKEAQLRAAGYTDDQLVKLGQAIADESMAGLPGPGEAPKDAGAPGADDAMAGMEQPNPVIMGMKDLPWRPKRCISRSITNAARAM